MGLIKWLKEKLKKKNLVPLYIIREMNDDNEIVAELYFKEDINRFHVYKNLMMLEIEPHYSMWCNLHGYKTDDNSWIAYLRVVQPSSDKYVLINARTYADSVLYTTQTYEEVIVKQKEEIDKLMKSLIGQIGLDVDEIDGAMKKVREARENENKE